MGKWTFNDAVMIVCFDLRSVFKVKDLHLNLDFRNTFKDTFSMHT